MTLINSFRNSSIPWCNISEMIYIPLQYPTCGHIHLKQGLLNNFWCFLATMAIAWHFLIFFLFYCSVLPVVQSIYNKALTHLDVLVPVSAVLQPKVAYLAVFQVRSLKIRFIHMISSILTLCKSPDNKQGKISLQFF